MHINSDLFCKVSWRHIFDGLTEQLAASSGHIHEVKCVWKTLLSWFASWSSPGSLCCGRGWGWFELGCTCSHWNHRAVVGRAWSSFVSCHGPVTEISNAVSTCTVSGEERGEDCARRICNSAVASCQLPVDTLKECSRRNHFETNWQNFLFLDSLTLTSQARADCRG